MTKIRVFGPADTGGGAKGKGRGSGGADGKLDDALADAVVEADRYHQVGHVCWFCPKMAFPCEHD